MKTIDSQYCKWESQRRVVAPLGEAFCTTPDRYLDMQEFPCVVAYITVVAGGSATTRLTFEHAMADSGEFYPISGSATLNGIGTHLVTFSGDTSARFLARKLRWVVIATASPLDVTFSLSVLQRS